MKSLLLAASAVSMLALAAPAMAQNPYDSQMHYAPDSGPQMRYMDSHDSTVLDRAPYAGSDAQSDQLSNHRVYFNHGPGMYQDR
jgi:hypothetical protein